LTASPPEASLHHYTPFLRKIWRRLCLAFFDFGVEAGDALFLVYPHIVRDA